MTGYTRQRNAQIVNNALADADDIKAELDQVQAAFNVTIGHTHDGSLGEGSPIIVTGPAQDFNFSGAAMTPKTTTAYDLGTSLLKFGSVFADNFVGNSSTSTVLATARTINGTSFNGSANITTTNWGTSRSLTIGNSTQSVNGSGNVTWSPLAIVDQGSPADSFNSWGTGVKLGIVDYPYGSGSFIASFSASSIRGFQIAVNSPQQNSPISFRTVHSNFTNNLSDWKELVDNTTNQTIAGSKTFSSAITLSTPGTTTGHAVRADRSISTSGIATGGGNLTSNRTINVPGTNLGSSGTGATRTITSSTGSNTTITYSIGDLNGVPTSRTLTAGDGLSGGGNLGANRTFAVDGTVVRTSGDQTISGGKTFTGTITANASGFNDQFRVIRPGQDAELSITPSGGAIRYNLLNGNSHRFSGGPVEVVDHPLQLGRQATVTGDAVRADRTITAGDGLSGGGNLTANRTLSVDSSVVRTSRSIGTSGIATGGGNLSSNRTINVPGTNLGSSGTGATRTITSSTGSNTSISYSAADLGAVPTSRTLTAGTGLTGGGNLSADRTINLASSERMTTANVLAQTAGASYGAVGSYVLAGTTINPGTLNPGTTRAGSALYPVGLRGASGTTFAGGALGAAGFSGHGTSLSGTWRLMGKHTQVGDQQPGASLWLRIS